MSLLAPLFLIGLFAIGIPWWLHRISTDDPPTQDFGSSMLLEQQQTVSSRHTRLRYLKLLSLRTLALILLALLFAEPVFNQLKDITRKTNRHLLVVDTSLSQSHSERWARTQTLAQGVINDIPAGDEIIVIGAADGLLQTNDEDYSKPAALANFNSLKPGPYRLAFNRFTRSIAASVKDSPHPAQVHFVSDMQKSAMPDKFTDLAITGVEKLNLYSTGDANDQNVSVRAEIKEAGTTATAVQVLVSNHSTEPASRDVTISSNNAPGNTLQTRNVQLSANARMLVSFDNIDTSNTNGALTIALTPADNLPLDDSFTLAMPNGTRTDIAVTSGTRNSVANTFVTAAIESDPRYQTRAVVAEAISANEAGAVVIIPDASVMTDRAATRLRDYINNGGTALVFVGNQPHSTNMANLLRASVSQKQTTTPARISVVDASQPLIADTANNWRALTVLKRLSVATTDDDNIILTTDDGAPLLIERESGDGRLLIFTSALDTAWNDLAVEPLFVAFVVRAIEYLQGETSMNPYWNIGDSIQLSPGAQLITADGESLRDITDLNTRELYTFTKSGVYTIKSVSGAHNLSVNTDPLESELQAADNATIEQWSALADSDNASNQTTANTTSATQAGNTGQRSIWYWLLLLLVALVLIESLYSHRHLWVKRGA